MNDTLKTLKESRDFYRVGFLLVLVLMLISVVATAIMAIRPPAVKGFVVFQNTNGQVLSVSDVEKTTIPTSLAELRANLKAYVETRMSFTAQNSRSLQLWQQYINWHSSDAVYNAFAANEHAPGGALMLASKNNTVLASVNAISFIKNAKGKPETALVDFSTRLYEGQGSDSAPQHYRATIQWRYTGTPSNYEIALNNWSGFEVTEYDIQPL